MQLQLETLRACPVCHGESLACLIRGRDHESGTGDYGIDVCGNCGVAFTNPRPLETELPKLYEARSTADFPNLEHGLANRLRSLAIDHYIRKQLRGCGTRDMSILDFGCGDGALSRGLQRFARKNGLAMRVTAVDFHEAAPANLCDCEPQICYQSQMAWQETAKRYDAIFLRHVLEHHPDPVRLLTQLSAALCPTGRLFIEVPNRRSVWAKAFGSFFSGYYLPRHLLHFDRHSLASTLRRAGFKDCEVKLGHTPLIGRSLGYLTGRNIVNTGVLGLATYPLQVATDVMARRSTTLRAAAGGHA